MEIYKKVGDEYINIGYEFSGFPANGIWLVKDGTQNLIYQLKDELKLPDDFEMNLRKNRDKIVRCLMDNLHKNISYVKLADLIIDAIVEKNKKD